MPTLASSLRRLLRISALYLLASAAHAQWLPSPDFNGPRFQHTATALPGGGVLVTGGDDGTSALASTLRHHGGNGQWTAAAPLPQPRLGHSGTLLRNGTVLIAGGTNASGGPLRSALTYDPVDDAFTPAPDLAVARRHHTATVLRDGRVLIVGGQGGAGQAALRSAELYDPANRTWSSASQMPGQGARHHTATLLQDGRVLVVAGMDNGETATANTAVYDPATDIWTPAAALPLAERRMFHTATLLPDGRVYVAGGEQEDGTVFNGPAWIYDPAANNWTAAASAGQRSRHSATLMPDGRVLVVGGTTGSTQVTSTVFYHPDTNTWTSGPSLGRARARHTATLLTDGRVLVAGGSEGAQPLTSAEIYDPASSAWHSVSTMSEARAGATATLLPDGRVMVVGGWTGHTEVRRIEVFDPVLSRWTIVHTLAQGRLGHEAPLLPDGRVLVLGGYPPGTGNPDQPLLIDLQPTTRPRPVITNSFTLQDPGAPLQLIGTGFTGDGEAAAGSPQQAASNLPQVRLQRMDGGATVWLDASMSADNGYTSRPLPHHLLPGLYQARVFSNAIASAAYTFELRALLAAPGAPTGVAATPGNAQVTVSWQAPVGGVTPASYTVTAQPGGASCTVLHPATSCTVTGLTNGTAYTFTVTANAPGGSTSAPPTVGVTPQPGAAPGPGGVQPVPTLSQWGLLSLGLLMLLAGLRQRASLTAA